MTRSEFRSHLDGFILQMSEFIVDCNPEMRSLLDMWVSVLLELHRVAGRNRRVRRAARRHTRNLRCDLITNKPPNLSEPDRVLVHLAQLTLDFAICGLDAIEEEEEEKTSI